ncbi:MAG: CoA transferase [Chloroflexi bacterium]|nr:CoA transferase [Chloroflexota bacterium]
MAGALESIRVVELGDFIAVPFAGKLLADLGADVIKVEPPEGDSARRFGPFANDEPHPECSGLFLYLNTNKRNLVLPADDDRRKSEDGEPKTDVGRRTPESSSPTLPRSHAIPASRYPAIADLLASADVLLHDLPAAEARDLGLTYEALNGLNSRLVVTAVTPYGHTGPYADWLGHDLNTSALGGMSFGSGTPDREPLVFPLFQGHHFAGLAGAIATLFALFGRRQTGRGQDVDVSESDCWATFLSGMGVQSFVSEGRVRQRTGHRSEHRPYLNTVLPCRDGFVCFDTPQRRQWLRFLEMIGNPDWASDPRFQVALAVGGEYADEVEALLDPWMRARTKAEIFELIRANRVPGAPVLTMAEVAEHPHLRERDYFVTVDHPGAGPIRMPGAPYQLSATPWAIRSPAPLLARNSGMARWRANGSAGRGDGAPGRADLGVAAQPPATASISLGESPANDPAPSSEPDPWAIFDSAAESDDALDKGPAPAPTSSASSVARPPSHSHTLTLSHPHTQSLPLRGIRVADFGWVWAGTVLGQTLADMGAEVIKIESRRRLDGLRLGRVFETGETLELNPFFHNLNRGKLSLTVDLRQPEGVELLKRLVAQSDVVVENFTPGVLGKYGLGYEALCQVRPDLVMISLSAAGQTGPLADILAYAPIVHSLSGLDSLLGYRGDRVLGSKHGYLDAVSSLFGSYAVLAALHHRAETGQGQYIDCSEWEVAASLTAIGLLEYTMTGRVLAPAGNDQPGAAPGGNYRCVGDDEWVSIAVRSQTEWAGLREALGNPAWVTDYDDPALRWERRAALDTRLTEWTRGQEANAVAALLQAHGVAAAPCLNTATLFSDPHLRARNAYVEVEHPVTGLEYLYGSPWHLSETPAQITRPAPRLGQHNDYVLCELLGLSEVERARLVEAQVVF